MAREPCQHVTVTVPDEETQQLDVVIPDQCVVFPAGLAIYYDFTREVYYDGETSGTLPPPFIFAPCQQNTLVWEECETTT